MPSFIIHATLWQNPNFCSKNQVLNNPIFGGKIQIQCWSRCHHNWIFRTKIEVLHQCGIKTVNQIGTKGQFKIVLRERWVFGALSYLILSSTFLFHTLTIHISYQNINSGCNISYDVNSAITSHTEVWNQVAISHTKTPYQHSLQFVAKVNLKTL